MVSWLIYPALIEMPFASVRLKASSLRCIRRFLELAQQRPGAWVIYKLAVKHYWLG
jgi:hypothetical protein